MVHPLRSDQYAVILQLPVESRIHGESAGTKISIHHNKVVALNTTLPFTIGLPSTKVLFNIDIQDQE